MVGPQKDWVKFPLDSAVQLVQETDGVRIIGTFTHEFLQRVPVVTEDVFKIGSMSEGALLCEAHKEFQVCAYLKWPSLFLFF